VNRPPNVLLLILLAVATANFSWASDIYVAQNKAGGDTGADCADAHSAAWFNSAANWGSGASQVGPGTTVHLCGTFAGAAGSTMLTTQGSGTTGNPITILFESGALFKAPYWSANGAIRIPNNFITLDGGTNGTIENTLNGTAGGACLGGACTQQQSSEGVIATGNNVTIQNLIVTHIYVHTEDVIDTAGDANTGIETDGSNSLVTHNTVDNVYTGIVNGGTNISNIEFSFNTLTFCNHCMKSAISSGNVTGLKMHHNDISSMYNWDEVDNHYHHNGIFVFALSGTHTGAMYYNNYIHGVMSRDAAYGATHVTGWIFLEYGNPGAEVFNNILESDPDAGGTRLNYPANGYITAGGGVGTQHFWNNTIIGGNNGGNCYAGGSTGFDFQNNVLVFCGNPIFMGSAATSITIDYNDYYNLPGDGWANGGGVQTNFATWKSSCACDAHSQLGNDPKLDGSYHLQSGSSAIQQGANLTSLGITLLDSDRAGVGRPGGTCSGQGSACNWDEGAYQFSTDPPVNPPTGLAAVVN